MHITQHRTILNGGISLPQTPQIDRVLLACSLDLKFDGPGNVFKKGLFLFNSSLELLGQGG